MRIFVRATHVWECWTHRHQTTSATAATTKQEPPPPPHACVFHLFRFVVNFRRQQLVTLQLSSENSEELERRHSKRQSGKKKGREKEKDIPPFMRFLCVNYNAASPGGVAYLQQLQLVGVAYLQQLQLVGVAYLQQLQQHQQSSSLCEFAEQTLAVYQSCMLPRCVCVCVCVCV